MRIRLRWLFYRWALLFIAIGVAAGTFIFLSIPENLAKLDMHGPGGIAENAPAPEIKPLIDYVPPEE